MFLYDFMQVFCCLLGFPEAAFCHDEHGSIISQWAKVILVLSFGKAGPDLLGLIAPSLMVLTEKTFNTLDLQSRHWNNQKGLRLRSYSHIRSHPACCRSNIYSIM